MRKTTFIKLFTVLILCLLQVKTTGQSTDSPEFEMSQIGSDHLLKTPWDLLVAPDGYLWVTERATGQVVRINPETAERDLLIKITESYSDAGQDGLLGMALHKDFESGAPFVYLSHSYLSSGVRKQKLVRYTYEISENDGSLKNPEVIIENLPSSHDHNSGRLIFGTDEKLYYTIGDQGIRVCDENLAQFVPTQNEIDQENWKNYPGKVLRINLDGSIPSDNPEFNGVKSHVYSIGHRNPQGLAVSDDGLVYSSEHGPSSDDEINIINSGKNYGWPYVAGYKDNLVFDNDGCHNNETGFTSENYQGPLLSIFPPDYDLEQSCNSSWMCRPNIAPSSLEIYQSAAIAGWENSLLIPSLKRGRIYRLKLDEGGKSLIGDTSHHFYTQNRYRDIAVSLDGESFYIITDGEGKTSDESGYNLTNSVVNPGAILHFRLINSCVAESTPSLSFDINYTECESEQFQIEYSGSNYTDINWDFSDAIIESGMDEGPYYLRWDSSGEKMIHFSASNSDCTADTTIKLHYYLEPEIPKLCLVTVDDVTGNNKLTWKTDTSDVVKYGIYKLINEQYDLLEYVETGQNGSYIDESANSDQKSEYYKITSIDHCDHETEMSPVFESIFLQINKTNNAILLEWNEPSNDQFESYSILRSLNGSEFDTLVSDLSGQYTFAYTQSVPGDVAYKMVGKLKDACDTESLYSLSNTVSTQIITSNPTIAELILSPNPATDFIKININSESEIHYAIRSISGKRLLQGSIRNNEEINLSGLESGIYFLQTDSDFGSKWSKILIK